MNPRRVSIVGLPLAVALLGLVAAAAAFAISVSQHLPWPTILGDQLVGLSYIVAGTIAWVRRPGNVIGPAIAVEKLPLAPMIASSSAPPRGNRSDVIPSIVGHQNAIAPANTAAAAKAAAGVLARLKRYSPAAAGSAVTPINATGEITCAARAPN